jgi:hypothetical protein
MQTPMPSHHKKTWLPGYLEKIEGIVKEHGHAVQFVMDERSMAYTVGAAGGGTPEFIIFGLPPQTANITLNNAVRLARAGGAWEGDVERIFENYKARLIPISLTAFYDVAPVAKHYHHLHEIRQVRAVQIIVPDSQNRFPGDPDYDMGPQIILDQK